MGIGILVLVFVLIILNVPIAFAIGIASAIYIILSPLINNALMGQVMFSGIDSFTLLSLPFFMLAGVLMEKGGISPRLIKFADALVGFVKGGLAMATVIASMIFAGISGASTADTAAIGSVTLPAMIKKGYDKHWATALQASAGSIGSIIPPSMSAIIYGVAGGVSIGSLFLGGAIPGILIGALLMVFSYIYAAKKGKGYLGQGKFELKKLLVSFKESFLALLMPVIVIGGIVFGIFTPTEAAAIAVVYALFIGFFVYKELSLKDIPGMLLKAAETSSVIVFILAVAAVFGWILTSEQIPQMLVNLLLSITSNKFVALFIINVFLLIIGTFLETFAAIILLTPVLLPVVTQFGVDPIHFGVIMIVNLGLGMLTPPMGTVLFVACSISKTKIADVVKPLAPIFLVLLIVLGVVTYMPDLILYLPRLAYGL